MGVEVAFQTAIYTRLNGNAPLGALIQGVYDFAPQAADGGAAAAFPYVTIGSTVFTLDPTNETTSFSALARIHTWSRSGAMLETKGIQGAIYDALHDHALSVTGFNCYSLLREDSDVTRLEDGRIHGVCEYRALLQKT